MGSRGKFFDEDSKGRADRPNVILVEGIDDAYFADAILETHGADPKNVGIVYVRGESRIAPELAELIKTRPYILRQVTKVAFLRDADTTPAQSVAELTAEIGKLGLPKPAHDAFMPYDNGRHLGMFIIPSATATGALEKLFVDSADPAIISLARDILKQTGRDGGPENDVNKRLVQIYLASADKLCRGGGLAFKRGVFPNNHAAYSAITDFLLRAADLK